MNRFSPIFVSFVLLEFLIICYGHSDFNNALGSPIYNYKKDSYSDFNNALGSPTHNYKRDSLPPPPPGWVDPYDLLGRKPPGPPSDPSFLCVQSDVEIQLLQTRCNNYEIQFRRLVNLFLQAADLRDSSVIDNEFSFIKLEFLLRGSDINTLKNFGQGGSGSPDVETVCKSLERIFSQKTPQDRLGFLHKIITSLQKGLSHVISSPEWTVITSVSLMLLLTIHFIYVTNNYRLALFTILLTIFIAGFGFTWMRMYEEKEVERFASILQHGEVPKHCSGQPLAWYEHIFYRMFGVDCTKFYKIRDIRPIVKISPTEVLAETVSSMVIKPSYNIAKAYSYFVTSLIGHVPWWLKPIALPVSFIIPILFTVILMAFLFNYHLSMSWTGFHLIPSWSAPSHKGLNQNTQYIQDFSNKQDNSEFRSLLTDSKEPVYVMNFAGLKKLSSSNLLNKSDIAEPTHENIVNEDECLKEENNAKEETNAEEMMESLIEFEKLVTGVDKMLAIEDSKETHTRKKRSSYTVTDEGSSSTNM